LSNCIQNFATMTFPVVKSGSNRQLVVGSIGSETQFLLRGGTKPYPHETRERAIFYSIGNRAVKNAMVAFLLVLIVSWMVLFSRDNGENNNGQYGNMHGVSSSYSSASSSSSSTTSSSQDPEDDASFVLHCDGQPCFSPAKMLVASQPGFPSFWKYGHKGPINATYDNRSLLINGERALFLSGSLHPVRATQLGWNYVLDEAVRNGLNMVTIYIMWAAHQRFQDQPIDWSLPGAIECDPIISRTASCEWDIATAIRAAADRGLFVHIRIGPYVCAEYNYGGIPEWVALGKPDMAMRRPNRQWMEAMEGFVTEVVAYLTKSLLWGHQGGPIIMGQIENELAGNVDPIGEHLLMVHTTSGEFVDREQFQQIQTGRARRSFRNATLQDYADWCGALVARLAPQVIWTMCSGLAANNTILTCNGECSTWWLEQHGENGRIQVDQPPILTEFEGGFQVWGEDPQNPSDYFWGKTARSMARDALKWFARGGTHLNYYMWWGGYNTGRAAAAGIMNKYASDAVVCPSGERREPKFGHFESLHRVMSEIAPTLLTAPTALGQGQEIEHLNKNGDWVVGKSQRIFEYVVDEDDRFQHVVFVENDADTSVVVKIPNHNKNELNRPRLLEMLPHSVTLFVDGLNRFDSASIAPHDMAFERKFQEGFETPLLLDWSVWEEPIRAPLKKAKTRVSVAPIEQTDLNINSGTFSDYAWYETEFSLEKAVSNATLIISTQKANAFTIFIDEVFVGAGDQHFHSEGPIELSVGIGRISKGDHKLFLLSESLGYGNLIGRWGAKTSSKTKGITGDVTLLEYHDGEEPHNTSLVDGRVWKSYPGLHGEALASSGNGVLRKDLSAHLPPGASSPPTWSSALFDTPRYDPSIQKLFLQITNGRGHLWLNGQDLGRYWNLTQAGAPHHYSQEYYFLPDDYLHRDGNLNEIVLFDSFGAPQRETTQIIMSWIEPAAEDDTYFLDEIDFPSACL
jgi:hypothetical protein